MFDRYGISLPLPPMPNDLGPAEVLDDEGHPRDTLMSVAAMLLAMRESNTTNGHAVYRRFVAEWNQIKHGPGPSGVKQAEAMKRALREIDGRLIDESRSHFPKTKVPYRRWVNEGGPDRLSDA